MDLMNEPVIESEVEDANMSDATGDKSLRPHSSDADADADSGADGDSDGVEIMLDPPRQLQQAPTQPVYEDLIPHTNDMTINLTAATNLGGGIVSPQTTNTPIVEQPTTNDTATSTTAMASSLLTGHVELSNPDTKKNDEEKDHTNDNDNDEDAEIQIISPQQAERELRRKRRRRLRRLLNQPNKEPSFLAVIQQPPPSTISDQEEEADGDAASDAIPPPVVVIDVDAYLGFKARPQPPMTVSSSSFVSRTASGRASRPSTVSSSGAARPLTSTTTETATSATTTPAEEGWYEGSRCMAMPEDATFLSDLHVWIREHLEFFSATDLDLQHAQSGRRVRTVRGKVGVRCIHCAHQVLLKLAKGEKASWPPGAVSYPLNFSGLYSGCSQKPQLHFEVCPNLPLDSKLATMLHQARASQVGNTPLLSGIGKRKRMVQGVSGLMYYMISCQRIGLQEVEGQGIRFTRDLTLDPLDFETTRMDVERERPDLIPRQYQNRFAPSPPTKLARASGGGRGPDRVGSSDRTTASIVDANPAFAGATSQQALQHALEEADDLQHRLIRRSDKTRLTDYMFLAISQMAVCHASAQDFLTRGKKTKLMRVGFAGFCCRHCVDKGRSLYSCRSFSSAADNLASAISNSFVLHLQKCPYTPSDIKVAMTALKRIHTTQMGQMAYGSQRKLFFELWERMRAADQPVPEGGGGLDESDDANNKGVEEDEWTPDMAAPANEDEEEELSKKRRSATIVPPPTTSSTTVDPSRPNSVAVDFPVSNDPETQQTLKQAQESWDPAENDHLILPEDRSLVSDYVFLTMRQLKVAMPRPADFRGNRRNNILNRMPGMCCIHCADDPTIITPSGRTFPSAPDNMATAVNSSLYNHLQFCPHLPTRFKVAFQHLRKIHSQQCQNLTFGSQRRFFNKVYAKIKAIPMTEEQLAVFSGPGSSMAPKKKDANPSRSRRASGGNNTTVLDTHSFVEGGTVGAQYWQCLKCRMVPFEFRGAGAIHYIKPAAQHLKHHISICQQDGMYLGWLDAATRELRSEYPSDKLDQALEPLIQLVVGSDEELASLFGQVISTKLMDTVPQTSGWWRRLPSSIDFDQLQSVFSESATMLGLESVILLEHPKWRRVLELMSPTLQCPSIAEYAELRKAKANEQAAEEESLAMAATAAKAISK